MIWTKDWAQDVAKCWIQETARELQIADILAIGVIVSMLAFAAGWLL